MAEDVVVLQPGDERAKKVAKAMASQTANDMIQAFGKRPMTSTEVARSLQIPITTASYHIENLLDAGLLQVADTRWSKKGREVKIYGLTNQVLIIAPPVSDLRAVLQKYTALFGIFFILSLALFSVLPALLPDAGMPAAGGGMLSTQESYAPAATGDGEKAIRAFDTTSNVEQAPAVPPVPFASLTVHDLVMAFFFGGCLVLFALMLYELHYWWRSSRDYRYPSQEKEQ
jgi:DNA-binding transcriptional ArsR family regulator